MGQMLRLWKTILELELDALKVIYGQIAGGVIEEIQIQKAGCSVPLPYRAATNWLRTLV
jgi:hypothetical protein